MEPPQQSARKGIMINLSLFQFLSFVRRGVFYTFMINYLFGLMHNVTSTALLGTLNMTASTLGQNLLWGKISDRYKIRSKLIVAGESIAGTAYVIVFLVHRSLLESHDGFAAGLSLIIGLSILEFFWSMSDVGWATLLTEVTTSKTRGGIVGSLNFIASLGRMIGINFAGFLYQGGEGFRQGTIFYIVVAMLATSAVLMLITSRTTEKGYDRTRTTTVGKASNGSYSEYNKRTYKWFLASLVIIVIGASCTSQVFLLFVKLPEAVNASDAEMSLILTAWTLGGMLASLLCGWLADRIGRVKVIMIGLALAFLTPLFYGLSPSTYVMAPIYGINGVSFWMIQTVGFTLAGDLIPEDRRGRLFSRYNAVMALSWGPAGLLVGGPLADFQTKIFGFSSYSAYVNTFYASSIIVGVGAAILGLKVAGRKVETA